MWTYEGRITIDGTVQIELDATAKVTITKGIHCAEGCVLTITGDNAGELIITNPDGNKAGIGSELDQNVGTININGGKITSTGGEHGAGIGAGKRAQGAKINISGGIIYANGGVEGAGIGGSVASSTYPDVEINISGGDIHAIGGQYAAGIGGGDGGNNGKISITGGEIRAQGGQWAAGIGSGYWADGGTIDISGNAIIALAVGGSSGAGIGGGAYNTGAGGDGGTIKIHGNATITEAQGGQSAAGIGGGNGGAGGDITISENATITLAKGGLGGDDNGAGIGGGAGINANDGTGDGGTINIEGGTISAEGGRGGAGIGGGRYGAAGDITISEDAYISSAKGGYSAAGIGEGNGGFGGNIEISGGDTRATGGFMGAGIGGFSTGDGGIVTISGGEITATGGTMAAGIGGGASADGGTINIESGTIKLAKGDSGGAGIGGGSGHPSGEINISGGIIVSATGGTSTGAGIGGGSGEGGGIINISGGTIKSAAGGTTSGDEFAAGIGIGRNGTGGTTKITGGSINATSTATPINPDPTNGSADVFLNKLTVDGFDDSLVTSYYNSPYGINDVYTDADDTLYFYLPATSGAELLALSFEPDEGNKPYYGLKYQREDNDENEEDLEYLQLSTPSANIDFINKKLTGLLPDANYDISIHNGGLGGLSLNLESQSLTQQSGPIIQANGDGEIPIDQSWMGESIDIVQIYSIPYSDSAAQTQAIPAIRGVTDALKSLKSTAPKSEGADGAVSNVTTDMEFSTDPNAAAGSWTSIGSAGVLNLPPGTYYFREKANETNFESEAVMVVIPRYQALAELDLAGTGLNLDLAYLMVVLLLIGSVIPLKKGI